MGKFASTGLLAATGGLAGLGQGLSVAARDYAKKVGDEDLAALNHQFELEKVKLADELAGKRQQERFGHEAVQQSLKEQALDRRHQEDMGATLTAQGMKHYADRENLKTQVGSTEKIAGLQSDTQKDVTKMKVDSDERIAKATLEQRAKDSQMSFDLGIQKLRTSENIAERQIGAELVARAMILNGAKEQDQAKFEHELKKQGIQNSHEVIMQFKRILGEQDTLRRKYGWEKELRRDQFLNDKAIKEMEQTFEREQTEFKEGSAFDRTKYIADTQHKIAKLDMSQVHGFVTDKDGKVYAVDKSGNPSDTGIVAPLKADGTAAKDGLLLALVKQSNEIQKLISDEKSENPSADYKRLLHVEALIKQLTGVEIGDPTMSLDKYDKGANNSIGASQDQSAAPTEEGGFSMWNLFKNTAPGNLGGGLIQQLQPTMPAGKPGGGMMDRNTGEAEEYPLNFAQPPAGMANRNRPQGGR